MGRCFKAAGSEDGCGRSGVRLDVARHVPGEDDETRVVERNPVEATSALAVELRLGALPEAEFVAVRVVKERQHASDFLLRWSCGDSLGRKIADCSLNVGHAETEAGVAWTGDRMALGCRHEFEQHAADFKASNIVARFEREAENVAIEGDGLVHFFYVVVNGVEGEFEGGVGHGSDLLKQGRSPMAKR